MTEEYKDYIYNEDYTGKYKISNTGNVWNIRNKECMKIRMFNEYNVVYLTIGAKSKKHRVDILVAETFLEQGENHDMLVHVDGDNQNNNADNLKWYTYQEYLKDKYDCNWKSIRDHPKYCVSDTGLVWSSSTKQIIKQQVKSGYWSVTIGWPDSKFYLVQRLVAQAFIEINSDNDYIVVHTNGDKFDNNVSNLEVKFTGCQSVVEKVPDPKDKYNCVWKPLVMYDKYYVSDTGLVWSSTKSQLLVQQVNKSGYMCVIIQGKTFQIHRLIAQSFIENKEYIVVHINGNTLDNRPDNLRWELVTKIKEEPYEEPHEEHSKEPLVEESNDLTKNLVVNGIKGVEISKYPGLLILPNGRVYNIKRSAFLSLSKHENGYYRVDYKQNDKKVKRCYVHILVAEAYLDEPTVGQTQVNHKNSDKADNRVENLEWCTRSENVKHSIANKPNQFAHLKKKVVCLNFETGDLVHKYDSVMDASRATGVNSGSITKVCKGEKQRAGVYKWKYDCEYN